MAIAAVDAHNGLLNPTVNVVMCPSHLIDTWEREIKGRGFAPEVIVVRDFDHAVEVANYIKRHRRAQGTNIWLIISKETAKLGYTLRPAAVWSKKRRCYCCPDCGQPLYYEVPDKSSSKKNKKKTRVFLGPSDFRKPSPKINNIKCSNRIRTWDEDKQDWVREKTCGTPLWTVATKENTYKKGDPDNKWVKLGDEGWFQKQHLKELFDHLFNMEKRTGSQDKLLGALSSAVNYEEYPVTPMPRKYPISKYIRKYLSGYIDYFIADEVHLLQARDSLQGESFGDFINVAKYVLTLTGTLLNGYASGIYYILCRMFPEKMKKEGFEFGNVSDFSKEYGVIRKESNFYIDTNGEHVKENDSKDKELPGISPLVFTKFLLENMAFMSLEDISEALPAYEEIPVPVAMPTDLAENYEEVEKAVSNLLKAGRHGKGRKVLGQLIPLLTCYPDMPYDNDPVIHPESGEVLISPPELPKETRPKDNALLEIAQRKVNEGEKVLVFYHWTNRTDVAERLPKLFQDIGIKTATLTTRIRAQDREKWINNQVKKGVQVILCNPALIETGLTLLDFTTIIYYQLGYNLYTMRQASRRSWRINQDHDIEVYFLYYERTAQEQALALMATKLQAAMAIEGKFSEEGLNALSNNEDILTEIASAVTAGIKERVNVQVFEKNKIKRQKKETTQEDILSDLLRPNEAPGLNKILRVNKDRIGAALSPEVNDWLTQVLYGDGDIRKLTEALFKD